MSALRWVVLTAAVLAVNFPVLVTAVTALKGPRELMANPGLTVREPTLANFAEVLTPTDRLDVFAYLASSAAAALIGSGLAVALCLPAAYAVARGAAGRRLLLPLVVNLRAIPLIVFAIPIYMVYQAVGLLDTRLGLGLVLTVVNLPLALVLLVNAVAEVPVELDEAARVDGVSRRQILLHVVLPLCRPAVVTTFLFGVITAWNEFLFGLMLTTREAVPVTVGASFFFATGGAGIQWGLASAVMLVAALPPMALGLLMYRQLAGSLAAGAVKG